MDHIKLFAAALFLMVSLIPAVPHLTASPSLARDGQGKYWVDFAVSESTDVAVSIVDTRDSAVVRHLAAGVLGLNAPAPFQKSSLSQRIEWDGRDDLGVAVSNPSAMAPRVRAGMSVRLVALVGDNPYSYTKGLSSLGGGVYGLAKGPGGKVFVCGNPGAVYHGHVFVPVKYLRAYDWNGDYEKTIYPIPANLTASQARVWGVVDYPANAYTPYHTMATGVPSFTNTIMSILKIPGYEGILIGTDSLDHLFFGNIRAGLSIGRDGSLPGDGTSPPVIRTPAPPKTLGGGEFFTVLPGGKSALFSGCFESYQNTVQDTGFYRDGRVFKVNLSTGEASIFLDLDSVLPAAAARASALLGGYTYAEIHGTDADSKGRVYVCDRLNRRIGVYDANALFLGGIPLRGADRVAVSRRTNAIFAVVRTQNISSSRTGTVKLFKFAPFDQGGAPLCSLEIGTVVDNDNYTTHIVVTDSGSTTRIWFGYENYGIRIYEDGGSQINLFKVFPKSNSQGFDRVIVDRRNETVYFQDNWSLLSKIESWKNPVILPCSTSGNRLLESTDATISPHGHLYVRKSVYPGPILRYTTDHLHAPLNWNNNKTNILTPFIKDQTGVTNADRGLSVGVDGKVAVMMNGTRFPRNPLDGWLVGFYGDSSCLDTNPGRVRIFPVPTKCGGVRVDLKGNLYIGAVTANAGHARPTAFSADWAYGNSVGSIMKFAAGFDTGMVTPTSVAGAVKTYPMGLAPFSQDRAGGNCICRSPRFDVDPYGRIFSPNAISCEITVADNEGNTIVRFGQYGNADSRGGLSGPGLTVPAPEFPFAYPTSAAASEDYIYVTDYSNCRLARVQMEYAADNMPGITANLAVQKSALQAAAPGLKLSVSPNPSRTGAAVMMTLPAKGRVRLDVFDPSGRFIATLASDILPAGAHRVAWDGRDRLGRPVAAGAYYLRLSAGAAERVERVTVVR